MKNYLILPIYLVITAYIFPYGNMKKINIDGYKKHNPYKYENFSEDIEIPCKKKSLKLERLKIELMRVNLEIRKELISDFKNEASLSMLIDKKNDLLYKINKEISKTFNKDIKELINSHYKTVEPLKIRLEEIKIEIKKRKLSSFNNEFFLKSLIEDRDKLICKINRVIKINSTEFEKKFGISPEDFFKTKKVKKIIILNNNDD